MYFQWIALIRAVQAMEHVLEGSVTAKLVGRVPTAVLLTSRCTSAYRAVQNMVVMTSRLAPVSAIITGQVLTAHKVSLSNQ